METPGEQIAQLPKRIRDRLEALDQEVETTFAKARLKFKTEVPRKIAFDFSGQSKDGNLIPAYERAQSVSFVTRYDHLPDDVKVRLSERDGMWHIGNFWVLRHVLNDFRPIIQNQKDSVFYAQIHRSWYPMLRRTNPAEGMVVRVLDEHDNDITNDYARFVVENKRAIACVLQNMEFEYLYNGVLQHSDSNHSSRLLKDYSSGELNYVVWKHIRVLGFIRSLLNPYYRIMHVLTFPQLGPL